MTKKKYGIRTVNGNEPDPITGDVNVAFGDSYDLQSVLINGNNSDNSVNLYNDNIGSVNLSSSGLGINPINGGGLYLANTTMEISNDVISTGAIHFNSSLNGNARSHSILQENYYSTGDAVFSLPLNNGLVSRTLATTDDLNNIPIPTLDKVVSSGNISHSTMGVHQAGGALQANIDYSQISLIDYNDTKSSLLDLGKLTLTTRNNTTYSAYIAELNSKTGLCLQTNEFGNKASLTSNLLTSSRSFEFPDQSGILAIVNQLPLTGVYVPTLSPIKNITTINNDGYLTYTVINNVVKVMGQIIGTPDITGDLLFDVTLPPEIPNNMAGSFTLGINHIIRENNVNGIAIILKESSTKARVQVKTSILDQFALYIDFTYITS